MKRKLGAIATVTVLAVGAVVGLALALPGDQLDPVRNVVVPCEVVGGAPPIARSSKNLEWVANRCGFVGTDIEFQSRLDSAGKLHDYAFVGTMGAGPRIFDITDPTLPLPAGGYADAGWENDVQVRGDIMVNTFDGVSNEPSSLSTCLQAKDPSGNAAGIDILKLNFSPTAAADLVPGNDFAPTLIDCVTNPPGGAHNATIAPNGQFLVISNCCSDWAIDVVDLRQTNQPKHVVRLIDESRCGAAQQNDPPDLCRPSDQCPVNATFHCVKMRMPNGSSARNLWRPHDVFFTADSSTMYVAAINSTWILRLDALGGIVTPLAVIKNQVVSDDIAGDPRNVSISHQADTTSDGAILVVSDERGGGLSENGCNTDPGTGVIGGLHFFALQPIPGQPLTNAASLTNPIHLGDYFTPAPLLSQDPLAGPLAALRIERGCTIHVFRWGGNGSNSPGPLDPDHDGVSRLPVRQATSAHYGAGTWWFDISGPSSNADGITEDPRSTWGNTRGWVVMPGADTWSAKEYKGHIFAADMVRGFDVFKFSGAAPTNVTLSLFKAACAKKGSTVTWRTAVENSLLGFNLFRVQGKKQVKLNKTVISAKAVGRAGGAKYTFADKAAKKNTVYTYKLQIIDLQGAKSFIGSAKLKKCVPPAV